MTRNNVLNNGVPLAHIVDLWFPGLGKTSPVWCRKCKQNLKAFALNILQNDFAKGTPMFNLSPDQKAEFGLKLATLRQEHADMDQAVHMLEGLAGTDKMMLQRLKRRKLELKDKISKLENVVMPDIIA